MTTQIEVNLQDEQSATSGYISWTRLEQHLMRSGELRPDETITRLVADSDGITYYVSRG